MLLSYHIFFLLSLFLFLSPPLSSATTNLVLPHQHPDPEAVAQDVHRMVNASLVRRQMLEDSKHTPSSSCLTGNPIDDCWRCDPHWASNRQKLADCGIGFGQSALGGKGGQIYVVTDSSDSDPVNPKPGTLRYGVLQDDPLWIIFSSDMTIKLKYELIVSSYKTIDGRGANVHITGGGCITLQYVSNIIIHNIHVHNCVPAGNAFIRSSPTHVGYRSKSDGDGMTIFGSSNIWIDHCSLSSCTDGLIDATVGTTALTISNSHFTHHNDVMLLGNSDGHVLDEGMQVTLAFNVFGEGVVQRMPRCRRGYVHVVNNDFRYWEIYVIGGSDNPTINSQGNRYTAPANPYIKEVTRRVESGDKNWASWNWRSEGDIMLNGAFFVPSGNGLTSQYTKASSIAPKSAAAIDQITMYAGAFGDPRDDTNMPQGGGTSTSSSSQAKSGSGSSSGSGSDGDTDYFGMMFGSGGPPSLSKASIFLAIVVVLIICTITNHDNLMSLALLCL
ncbi:probable pectate lyase 18 [Chenopodium quinoa]|uniref:probable pectate lyase 18 n=1 Tax=Chenopodium quinoa TaxID=63459 RepID=UPI000B783316|nr:probable pectate lyase 18 [Chenopodium quinoa]